MFFINIPPLVQCYFNQQHIVDVDNQLFLHVVTFQSSKISGVALYSAHHFRVRNLLENLCKRITAISFKVTPKVFNAMSAYKSLLYLCLRMGFVLIITIRNRQSLLSISIQTFSFNFSADLLPIECKTSSVLKGHCSQSLIA